ncbi:MAG: hypothetical protein HC790_03150 [Acaryochloridaceae cyanobacterium CSU_3_4]|nr:hypothetical protein [Acaryochloridaceae cyanobacterium CSU_3_4]
MKSTLPPSFQRKLARLQRQPSPGNPAVLVQQLALFTPTAPSSGFSPSPSPCQDQHQEFNHWFELAQRLKLVTDSEWIETQYWVEANSRWLPYAEMIGIFPVPVLQRMLTQVNRPSTSDLGSIEVIELTQSPASQPRSLKLDSSRSSLPVQSVEKQELSVQLPMDHRCASPLDSQIDLDNLDSSSTS